MASFMLRFGVDVRNGPAGLRYAPKCRGTLTLRSLGLSTLEPVPLFVALCAVKGKSYAHALASLGAVYRKRIALLQEFVDTHKLRESERVKIEEMKRDFRKAVRAVLNRSR